MTSMPRWSGPTPEPPPDTEWWFVALLLVLCAASIMVGVISAFGEFGGF